MRYGDVRVIGTAKPSQGDFYIQHYLNKVGAFMHPRKGGLVESWILIKNFFVFRKCWKGKASAAVAAGLRNAYVLKNWVVKHQFLSESTSSNIDFVSPRLELGIFLEIGEI